MALHIVFVKLARSNLFGFETLEIDHRPFRISSPEKTLVDCFAHPEYCGGLVEAAKGLWTALHEHRLNLEQVTRYAERLGNRPVLKRMGYLIEHFTVDLTLYEKVVLPLETRLPHHSYSDAELCRAEVAVYRLEEMLAEKLKALLRRRYARDVYDLWFLFKYHSPEMDLKAARRALDQKCQYKGYTYSNVDDFLSPAHRPDLERTWTASLQFQTRNLPAYEVAETEFRKWIGNFLNE